MALAADLPPELKKEFVAHVQACLGSSKFNYHVMKPEEGTKGGSGLVVEKWDNLDSHELRLMYETFNLDYLLPEAERLGVENSSKDYSKLNFKQYQIRLLKRVYNMWVAIFFSLECMDEDDNGYIDADELFRRIQQFERLWKMVNHTGRLGVYMHDLLWDLPKQWAVSYLSIFFFLTLTLYFLSLSLVSLFLSVSLSPLSLFLSINFIFFLSILLLTALQGHLSILRTSWGSERSHRQSCPSLSCEWYNNIYIHGCWAHS